MKLHGKAQTVGEQVLAAFKTPDLIPDAMANVFLKVGDKPSNQWSNMNRFIMALSFTDDARGFKQWLDIGRTVRKGEKAIYILAPLIKRNQEANGDKLIPYGFKAIPVFRKESTEGDELPDVVNNQPFIDSLPFIDLADKWGITIDVHDIHGSGSSGCYSYSLNTVPTDTKKISLAVENLATWAHELTHAADHRLGNLTTKRGQQLDNEFVAELGGCILLKLIGKHAQADLGGCFEYLSAYAKKHDADLFDTAYRFLNRTCHAIELILTESATAIAA